MGGGYTKWGFPQQRSQTPNFVCQTLNILCQTPRISKPNTQNPVAFFPKFRSKSPTTRSTLPAVWSPRGAPRSPPFALSGAKCGVRAQWGPTPPFDPPGVEMFLTALIQDAFHVSTSVACQKPKLLCQTPNILSQISRISKPNTRNPEALFPKIRSNLPTSLSMLPAAWSPSPNLRSSPFSVSGAKCWLRIVGVPPPA